MSEATYGKRVTEDELIQSNLAFMRESGYRFDFPAFSKSFSEYYGLFPNKGDTRSFLTLYNGMICGYECAKRGCFLEEWAPGLAPIYPYIPSIAERT